MNRGKGRSVPSSVFVEFEMGMQSRGAAMSRLRRGERGRRSEELDVAAPSFLPRARSTKRTATSFVSFQSSCTDPSGCLCFYREEQQWSKIETVLVIGVDSLFLLPPFPLPLSRKLTFMSLLSSVPHLDDPPDEHDTVRSEQEREGARGSARGLRTHHSFDVELATRLTRTVPLQLAGQER